MPSHLPEEQILSELLQPRVIHHHLPWIPFFNFTSLGDFISLGWKPQIEFFFFPCLKQRGNAAWGAWGMLKSPRVARGRLAAAICSNPRGGHSPGGTARSRTPLVCSPDVPIPVDALPVPQCPLPRWHCPLVLPHSWG